MIHHPSQAKPSFASSVSPVIQSVPTRGAATVASGAELTERCYNHRMNAPMAQNKQQPCVQNEYQPFAEEQHPRHWQPIQQQQPVQLLTEQHHQHVHQVQQQVLQDERLIKSNTSIFSEEATNSGHRVNTVKDSMGIGISFNNFPYYLSERTKHHLVGSYFMMKQKVQTGRSKLRQTKPRIMIAGPEGSDIYLESLAIALSNQFGPKLLVLDCHRNLSELSGFGHQQSNDALRFYLHPIYLCHRGSSPNLSVSQSVLPPLYANQTFTKGDRVIFTGLKYKSTEQNIASRGPSFGYRGEVIDVVKFAWKGVGVRFDMPIHDGNDFGGLCTTRTGFFCDPTELVMDVEEQASTVSMAFKGVHQEYILFVQNAEKCLGKNETYRGIYSMVNKLPDNVFVIGSHIIRGHAGQKENLPGGKEKEQFTERFLLSIFSNKISIEMPQDPELFDELKHKLHRDAELQKVRENTAQLCNVITQHELECEDIGAIRVTDQKLTNENAEMVIKWALGYEMMTRSYIDVDRKLLLSKESVLRGLDDLRAFQAQQKHSPCLIKDIATANEFEKKVLENVIFHNEIGVRFEDIGAQDAIKDTLKELVMLPFQMPDLFCKGKLRRPCRAILLFGPSGTGKTMLAKAVATEAGANFFNISTSSITSKLPGEFEKYVKAIFSLASKIAPSIVFINEVDSLLGKRKDMEHEITRRIKNEFMLNWDGLQTKDTERVVVLAATNRPFDLEEGVIRRFPRRILVNLPDLASRAKIIQVILAKEELSSDVDFYAIARLTEGFSCSDLKNMCIAAAYCPVREVLKKGKFAEGEANLRPLNLEDFKCACDQVKANVCTDSWLMAEMLKWNELYGEGGYRRKRALSYFI